VSDKVLKTRIQDRALDIATRLASISIQRSFYDTYPQGKYPRLKKESLQIFHSLQKSARNELKISIPETDQKETDHLS
jgi:hypothetical protein